jgi:hypothetical protein
MDNDIRVGKRILNEAMGGNPFKQLSSLRKAILALKNNQDVIIKHCALENSNTVVESNLLFDVLLEENSRIEAILVQEYPDEYEVVEETIE